MSLRIIGGSLRGKKLHTVRGMDVRPTADRLRESIFNILSFRIRKAVVLDLFAGTGALGIEAISRGAGSAVFIDNNPAALAVISRNIEDCAIGQQAKTIKWNIKQNLNCIKACDPAFNLVFADPPYNRNIIQTVLLHLSKSNALKNEACVIIEHAVEEPLQQDLPAAFKVDDQRRYGKTLVSFLSYVV